MADQLIKRERKKAGIDIRGPQTIGEQRWNEPAGADKVLPVNGLFRKPYLGPLTNAVEVSEKGKTVAVYNDSAVTAYVATGDSTLTAPTSAANGIAVPPYEYMYVSMGEDLWVRGSASTVYGYEMVDDTYISG